MSKQADLYFEIDPWRIIERGFDPEHGEVAESIFSLGNEYMGLRGYFEEGYSGKRLQGSYLGGVYERVMLPPAHYKGMVPFIELMVNSVDWVSLPISCNGVRLDLAKADIEGFERALDLRTGVLTRGFVWRVDGHTRVKLTFERFLSMVRPSLGGQRLTARALEGEAALTVEPGLDFSQPHVSSGQNHWDCSGEQAGEDFCRVSGQTKTTKQQVFAAAYIKARGAVGAPVTRKKQAAVRYDIRLSCGDSFAMDRLATLLCRRDFEGDEAFAAACDKAVPSMRDMSYDVLREESADWWREQWRTSDIELRGDEKNQQGIRYSIFQLHQTLHTADRSAIIGAKGLTGEAYSGNAFWDSEAYCLPFYMLNNPRAARNILRFRCDTLPEAKERARALDLEGAYYPVATISGHECCNLWQHANLQMQPSTAVAYGMWHYAHVTGDTDFLYGQCAEVLIEICRMLHTRGGYDPTTGQYGYYCVMGPDEFQMMVPNNTYTNLMAKRTYLATLETLDDMKNGDAAAYEALAAKTGLTDGELEGWRGDAEHMKILYDEKTKLFEQHDGFFKLPHVEISEIPIEQFPLYDHWAYDRLYRNDMIKQPDVLMFMLLYNSSFTAEQIAANFDYYEPRCIHESSLSPSVHSILAAQLGRMEQAYDFFGFATRLDLDNYNRNTRDGLHTTAIAASWMNIVYGFGGLRTDGDTLALWPVIPDAWEGYRFSFLYRGVTVNVDVSRTRVTLTADGEAPEMLIFGKPARIAGGSLSLELVPRERL